MKARKEKTPSMFRRIARKVSQRGITSNPKKTINYKTSAKQEMVAQGWMWKKSHGLIRSAAPWKKRWFVLYGNNHLVWSNFPKAKTNNALQLCEEYEIKPLMGSSKDPFCFMIWETKTERRVMKLATVKEADHGMWLEYLAKACSRTSVSSGAGASIGQVRSLLRKSSSKIELTSELQIVSDRASFKGFLSKKPLGRTEGKWHRRYFVLDGVRLLYFKASDDDRVDETKAGMVVLSPCAQVDAYKSEDDTANCFKVETKSGTLYAAAFSSNEKNAWIESIRRAVLDLKEEIGASKDTTKRGILHFPKVHGVGSHGKWQERFVALEGGALTLFKTDEMDNLKESYDLTSCGAIPHDSSSARPKGAPSGGAFFSLENPAWVDLSRHVRAPTQAIMHQWVNAIRCAVDRRRIACVEAGGGGPARGSELRKNGYMNKSMRLSWQSAGDERSMLSVKALLHDFCPFLDGSESAPSNSLAALPEDTPAKDLDATVARKRKGLSMSIVDKLAIRILAYGHSPFATARQGLFGVYARGNSHTSSLSSPQVYIGVRFREQSWITCHTLEEVTEFVEEMYRLCEISEKDDEKRKSWALRVPRRGVAIGLEARKDGNSHLRTVLDAAMESDETQAAHLFLFFLKLVPMPLLTVQKAFATLTTRATGDESQDDDDDVTVVSTDIGAFLSPELDTADSVLRDASESLSALVISTKSQAGDDNDRKIELKVWDAVSFDVTEGETDEETAKEKDGEVDESTAATKASEETVGSACRSRWWSFRCDISELSALRRAISDLGLPAPACDVLGAAHTSPSSSSSELSKGRLGRIFGKGDLSARLIKMFFDEMPVRLLEPVESVALALAGNVSASVDEQNAAAKACVEALVEPNRSILLWLLDLMGDVASNEDETKMGHYGLSVVFAPNLLNLKSDGDAMQAQMAFNVAVKSLEQLSLWRSRTHGKAAAATDSSGGGGSSKTAPGDDDCASRSSVDADQFGVPLSLVTCEPVAGYDASIPSLLVRLKEVLVTVGAFRKVGIFRVSPKNEDVGIVRDMISSGELFGGEPTRQRNIQQFVTCLTKQYYGLDCVLDFFRVKKDSVRRRRLRRLFWLSTACNIRESGEEVKRQMQVFHDYELSYNESTPVDLVEMTRALARDVAKSIAHEAPEDTPSLNSSTQDIVLKLWSLLRSLFLSFENSDDLEEKTREQEALSAFALSEIRGEAPLVPGYISIAHKLEELRKAYKAVKRAYYADEANLELKRKAVLAKKALQEAEKKKQNSKESAVVHLRASLKLLIMFRLFDQQMKAFVESKSLREANMRRREEELRQKKREPTHIEVTQFFMSYMFLGSSPWSWITDRVAIGTMPIKTKLKHGSKLLQESGERCDGSKSLSLIVAVATEEELAGLNSAVDPVSRQEWEENGVDHLRIDLDEEKTLRNTPNVSKSKKRAAASWAAQLSTATRKIHKSVCHGSCAYIHDTFEETCGAWVVLMSYLITYGKLDYKRAKEMIYQKRPRLKPSSQQEQRVRAFSGYFATSQQVLRGAGQTNKK